MVRNLLVLALLAFSVSSFAKPTELDPTTALVLTLGASPAKITQLMTGANALKVVSEDNETETVIKYTFTSQRCDSGVVFICKDLATLQINAIYVNEGERSHSTYTSGPVVVTGASVGGSNPQGFRCLSTINCMPVVAPAAQKYCTADYAVWAKKNCATQPSRLD